MKTSDSHQQSHTSNNRFEQPFFGAKAEQAFFSKERSKPKPFFNPSSIPLQAKLTVGAVGEEYEQEADHVEALVSDHFKRPVEAADDDHPWALRMGEPEANTPHRLEAIHITGGAAESTTIQRAIIIGEPRDGSYYNSFSSVDVWNYLQSKKWLFKPQDADDVLKTLQKWDSPKKANFATWQSLIDKLIITDEELDNIDEEAFNNAIEATEHLRPEGIEVDWQYRGNIAEATTRFVGHGKERSVMIDVNEEDTGYSKVSRRRRLGQRTTLFIHEMAYHANREAYQRLCDAEDDPDYDHRTIFMRHTRDKYLTGFLHGLLQLKDRVSQQGLIDEWYVDVKHHIQEYKRTDTEAEEALEWLEEAKDEMEAGLEE